MSISYKLNQDKNGVEIKFTEKPSEKVRNRLKELGFRWSNYNGVWYAKQAPETIAYAKELSSDEGEQLTLNRPTEEPKEEPKEEVKADPDKSQSEKTKAYEEFKKAKAEKLAKTVKNVTEKKPEEIGKYERQIEIYRNLLGVSNRKGKKNGRQRKGVIGRLNA